MSRRKRLTLLLTLCISLDFGSPFVAGAFRFDADESLEGLSPQVGPIRPDRFVTPAPVPPARDVSRMRSLVPARGPEGRGHEGWVVELRRSHAPASRPPSSTEDH